MILHGQLWGVISFKTYFLKRPKACINLMGEKEGSEVTETDSSLNQFQGVTNGIEFQIVTKEGHYTTT